MERQCVVCQTDTPEEYVDALGCQCQGTMGIHLSCRLEQIRIGRQQQGVSDLPTNDVNMTCNVCKTTYTIQLVRESACWTYLALGRKLFKPAMMKLVLILVTGLLYMTLPRIVAFWFLDNGNRSLFQFNFVWCNWGVVDDGIRWMIVLWCLGALPGQRVKWDLFMWLTFLTARLLEHGYFFPLVQDDPTSCLTLWTILCHQVFFVVASVVVGVLFAVVQGLHQAIVFHHGRIVRVALPAKG